MSNSGQRHWRRQHFKGWQITGTCHERKRREKRYECYRRKQPRLRAVPVRVLCVRWCRFTRAKHQGTISITVSECSTTAGPVIFAETTRQYRGVAVVVRA
jgi:hypothetical protein